jgi:hypothetical protein
MDGFLISFNGRTRRRAVELIISLLLRCILFFNLTVDFLIGR